MNAERRQKIAYAKQQYKSGVHVPAALQKAVKKKFGSGLAFMDLGTVFPASKKKSKKKAGKRGRPAGKRGPGRPAGSGKRGPGRPAGSTRDSILLLTGDEVELFSSRRQLEARVAEMIADGVGTGDLAVYQKTNMRLTVRNTISI